MKADYFPSCKRSDPQIEKCVLNGLEAMRPHLREGIPEVNIPALDPFTVPTLKLDRTAPNLRLKATVKHAKAYGGSDFKIEKLKLNLNNKYAGELKLTLPRLMVVANYDVKGSRLLTLDINGKGRLRGNFTASAVSFFNASPNVVLDILNPLIEETTAAVIKAFVNKVLGSIPISEVLTDDAPAA
ncbi:hypothetical protein HW555_007023 [Spodoptera exigua]|uniref:Uncharacterized protein n=1 Tax=Spodoptera exigua TaxID=7107 RepID=A0A835GGV0_SPOEX|nr:hypothetical protein HW555_007023 [Spodoptera exigua]